MRESKWHSSIRSTVPHHKQPQFNPSEQEVSCSSCRCRFPYQPSKQRIGVSYCGIDCVTASAKRDLQAIQSQRASSRCQRLRRTCLKFALRQQKLYARAATITRAFRHFIQSHGALLLTFTLMVRSRSKMTTRTLRYTLQKPPMQK